MLKKYFITISITTIFLSTCMIAYAQEKIVQIENVIVQQNNMEKYIEVIASDSTMRIEMMNLMIEKCQGNSKAMFEIGKTIIRNPEMNKIMKEMLKNDESIEVRTKTVGISKGNMIMESIKPIKKPKYDSNQN